LTKLTVITDLHIGFNVKKIKVFEKFIQKLDTDLLLLCGDVGTNSQAQIEEAFNIINTNNILLNKNMKTLFIPGNHCLDKKTELLTKRGWINYKDIKKTDLVFSINPKDNGEWVPIDNMITKKSKNIYTFNNSTSLDMAITKGHRIPHYKRKKTSRNKNFFSDLEYGTVQNIKGRARFPVARNNTNNDYPISDLEIQLLGWILSNGSVVTRGNFLGYTIHQSKPKDISKIMTILDGLNYDYSRNIRTRDIKEICGKKCKKPSLPENNFYIKANSTKFLKEWIGSGRTPNKDLFNLLSARQINILLRSMMDGDGSCGRTDDHGALNGTKEVLDWVQTLSVQAGVRSSLIEYRTGHFRLNLAFTNNSVEIDEFSSQVNVTEYNDTVWCLQVKNTNFMVRRNGCSYFTGNCQWDADNKFKNVQEIDIHHRKLCEKYNIHYLEHNKFENDDLVVYGFGGWYKYTDPNTNDFSMMPQQNIGGATATQWLQKKEIDAVNYILDDIDNTDEGKVKIIATHFNFIVEDQSYERMSGNTHYGEILTPLCDYYFFGHTHQEYDKMHDNCRVINIGADYHHSPNLDYKRFWKTFKITRKNS
jgi:predicted phosphodiesterase